MILARDFGADTGISLDWRVAILENTIGRSAALLAKGLRPRLLRILLSVIAPIRKS